MAGNSMSAKVLALSHENRRFLSCHGQMNCKSFPPSNPLLPGRTAKLIARKRRDPDFPSDGRNSRGWVEESRRLIWIAKDQEQALAFRDHIASNERRMKIVPMTGVS